MGEKGSVTVETTLIFPLIISFIALCLSAVVILYNSHRNKIISQRKLSDSSVRRPWEVIRNSEYLLELAGRAKDLLNLSNRVSDRT